ncbi:TetR family transcriptional regulator [Spirillospora sp. NPDC048819]|uniref:TetR family transcriptional regulator n=1 Tax=Spirillospora sp. NPDC048819 TaxID=3155268 RepID=UPI0033D639BA
MRSHREPAPGQRQRDAERTKRLILRAALTEFSRAGFKGARVAAIAARAGVNTQLISYYFGGKQGLHDAIHTTWLQAETQITAPDQPFGEVVADYVPLDDERRDFVRLLAMENLQGGDAKEREGMRHALADLERRQRDGEIAADLDPACLLLALVAAAGAPAVYSSVMRAVAGDEVSEDQFARHYAAQLTRIVERLGPRPGDETGTAT